MRNFFSGSTGIFASTSDGTMFNSTSNSSCSICFLGYVITSRITNCLTNRTCGECTIVINNYGSYCGINYSKATNCRACTSFTNNSNMNVNFISGNLFIAKRSSFSIILFVRFIASISNANSKMTRRMFCTFFFWNFSWRFITKCLFRV